MEILLDGGDAQTPKFEDDYRLIHRNKKDIHIYIDEIKEYIEVLPILKAINTAEKDNTLYLHINSPGGNLQPAMSIVNAIVRTEAKTIAVCDMAASAATLITLSCDEVWVTPLTEFMVHSVTSGSYGNTKENKELAKHQEVYYKDLMITAYQGFLPKQTVLSVIENADTLWLYGSNLTNKLLTWVQTNENKILRIM